MIKGLHLLKGDLLETLPKIIQDNPSSEWIEFISYIQNLRDEIVTYGKPEVNSGSIEHLSDFFVPVKTPLSVLPYIADMFAARYRAQDDLETIRKRLSMAMSLNRIHATTSLIRQEIERITGIEPTIQVRTDATTGWDENESVTVPPSIVDFEGGIMWDEDDTLDSSWPVFIWQVLPSGLLIDIKNSGSYTSEQLDEIYALVAELKNADLAADVGYVDTVTGQDVILKTIYSSTIADPPFPGYTETTWPSNPDPGQ